MNTINISIPEKLKKQAQELVSSGFYASFSDLVRDSIRDAIKKNKYDLMFEQAKRDEKDGKATILKTEEDIEEFMNSL
ncbi:MAG: Addiction module antidote protein, CC2985 family [Candidatus Woesebacteria bacterium GW2011_GWB1_38_5b]|uniref:Addiction module antidote protein, CC2985 family n=1 Tax=Candidatus Woesebacteria bacterium GW2011_GWB1_38_5b TaxID=1618569 RepID=A0A0G0K949_9BACT|nr:MAG: Addiction module antidote protein, CC2985 family [Candidatus Woesebacteria bacterium GW2011_GWB1_38_5b]